MNLGLFTSPCLYSWQIFLFTKMSRPALWLTQQPALTPVAIFAELKQPKHKTAPRTAEVKNTRGRTLMFHTS
jgi:hypothetical protein